MHFARIDYQDRLKRKAEKSLEVIWQGSKTFGSSAQVKTSSAVYTIHRIFSIRLGTNFCSLNRSLQTHFQYITVHLLVFTSKYSTSTFLSRYPCFEKCTDLRIMPSIFYVTSLQVILCKLQDNHFLVDYNVQERVEDFINAALNQVHTYISVSRSSVYSRE